MSKPVCFSKLMPVVLFFALIVTFGYLSTRNYQIHRPEAPTAELFEATKKQFFETYGKLSLAFEANDGQFDEQVKFVTRGQGYTMFLTNNEAVLSLRGSETEALKAEARNSESPIEGPKSTVVRMKLVGANAKPTVTAHEELPGKSNYFKGSYPAKWRTNVPNYKKVRYQQVYDGIDLVYYGNQRRLEYDFVVAPGVNPDVIRMKFDGLAENDEQIAMAVADNGDLLLQVEGGEIRQQKPFIYQEIDGARQQIDGEYELLDGHQVAFAVADYDAARPLVIDPVLLYSTFLGSSGFDLGRGIAVDASGSAYVTGRVHSDYPTTSGAFDETFNRGSNGDAFVSKLSADGSSLVYSTFLGGNSDEVGIDIAVDASGNAYVTGDAREAPTDFPTTSGAFDETHNGLNDAFVSKLSADGSSLVYSTFLGGSSFDRGFGIAVDASGNAYITGDTDDSVTDFPTTSGAFDETHNGDFDAFVSKLSADGSSLIYSTFLGGSGSDDGNDIAVDASGNAYITGETFDAATDLPTTSGAFDETHNGLNDAFVSKLSADGSSLVYSTFLGGGANDEGRGIAVDASGNTYIAGETDDGVTDLPTTSGAFDEVHNGDSDAFVSKFSADGSSLLYSTFLGGSSFDRGFGIAVDASGNAYITGDTEDGDPDLPTTSGAFDETHNGGCDAFVSQLSADGSSLSFSTFLGGSGDDDGFGIAGGRQRQRIHRRDGAKHRLAHHQRRLR